MTPRGGRFFWFLLWSGTHRTICLLPGLWGGFHFPRSDEVMATWTKALPPQPALTGSRHVLSCGCVSNWCLCFVHFLVSRVGSRNWRDYPQKPTYATSQTTWGWAGELYGACILRGFRIFCTHLGHILRVSRIFFVAYVVQFLICSAYYLWAHFEFFQPFWGIAFIFGPFLAVAFFLAILRRLEPVLHIMWPKCGQTENLKTENLAKQKTCVSNRSLQNVCKNKKNQITNKN